LRRSTLNDLWHSRHSATKTPRSEQTPLDHRITRNIIREEERVFFARLTATFLVLGEQ
jgi:hypothetical protein